MFEATPTDLDAIVVGAGPAGLLACDRLRAQGLRCAVLEAGPLDHELPDDDAGLDRLAARREVGNRGRDGFITTGLPSEVRRIRAAGGGTLAWGGWAHRFTAAAFSDAAARGTPWPGGAAGLEPWLAQVERRIGVRRGRVPERQRRAARALGLRLVAKRTARHGTRPWVATDLRRTLGSILPGATVVAVELDGDGRAAGVCFADRAGNLRRLGARAVLLCASTVETLRLLLDPALRPRLARGDVVGSGVVDHLVGSWLALGVGAAPHVADDARHGFVERPLNRDDVTRRGYVGGFCMEVGGPLPATSLGPMRLELLGWTAADAAHHHAYVVHAMGDVGPHSERRLTLDHDLRDPLGRALPRLALAWGEEDAAMAADMAQCGVALCDVLIGGRGTIVPMAEPLASGGPTHLCGGCRVGDDEEAPATAAGEVRGVPGLFVADGSAMPSVGDAHPTLTLLALTARTADGVAARLRARRPA